MQPRSRPGSNAYSEAVRSDPRLSWSHERLLMVLRETERQRDTAISQRDDVEKLLRTAIRSARKG